MLLVSRILEFRKQLENDQWRFLLTGGIDLSEKLPDFPKCDWLSVKSWGEIFRLSKLGGVF